MSPLVSIIVPCFNAKKYIQQAIESCFLQGYSNVEVIVVDDGSTDGSLSVVENMREQYGPDRLRCSRKDNGGASSARNLGVQLSRGDYFLFLDADDLLKVGSIQSLLALVSNSKADMAVGGWTNFSEGVSHRVEHINLSRVYPNDAIANLLSLPPVLSAFLIKRNERVWNEEMVVWEVFDYVFSLLIEGFSVCLSTSSIVSIRQHSAPDRVSNKHDHFEPLKTGWLFANYKRSLRASNLLTEARAEVLDQKILSNAYALFCKQRPTQAMSLCKELSWKDFHQYTWFKPTGISGFTWLFGPEMGISTFHSLNRLLGRA